MMATLLSTRTTTTTRLISPKACHARSPWKMPAWILSFCGMGGGALNVAALPTLLHTDPFAVTVQLCDGTAIAVGGEAGAFTGERMGVSSNVDPRAKAGFPNSA